MHEVSLAEGILALVESEARKAGVRAVKAVRIEAGELSGVDPDALRFAFESVCRGSLAAHASLVIERPEGRAWCAACRLEVRLRRYGDACPRCGGFQLLPVKGRSLRVLDFVPDEAPRKERR